MSSRLLVVEDDEPIRTLLVERLERAGHHVDAATDAPAAERTLVAQPYDLVVLDVMLPGGSGLEICRRLRAGEIGPGVQRPPIVLLLTARTDEQDAIAGFDAGADDYVRKPFGVRELLSRIEALLRLRERAAFGSDAGRLDDGALVVASSARTVRVGDTVVKLTPMEFDLLCHFLRHPSLAHSRNDLLSAVWGYSHDGYARTVDAHVTRIRRKLMAAGLGRDPIDTVHGVGYRYVRAVASDPSDP
jgi:DNA-binding response OmpR family regulator